ncbi:MAG: sigma-70 family RNA polymerase sigma factor [Myxococcales bacterium]|nr:sigma-70 family RNA polymerase sigma factor [Myxococcales bacterium]
MSTESVNRDPHALLAHAAWLRRLARSLVGDGAAADDLVQEAWVAALRHPPDTARPLRPWLRRVLENAARFRWRGDANRAAREASVAAAAADAATPSSDELLERHEAQRLLAQLVSELEEPYRSTILLRYAEGLEPTEIARRQGVPAGTVRWRVNEGLARLRAQLDDAHRGDRRAWLLALGPLATPGGAATGAGGGAGASGAGATGRGAWALVIGAAALVVIALLVSRSASSAGPHADAHDRAMRGVAAADTRADRAGTADAYARVRQLAAARPAGWMAQEGAPARRIAGRVVDGGAPAAGVLVRLTSDLSLAGLVPALEQRTDASGRFDFGEQVAREYAVGATAPARLAAIARVDLRQPSPRTPTDALELALLPCAGAYFGRVLDVGGSPIAYAQLLREDVIGVEADADGRYELCVLPSAESVAQLRVVVRAPGYGAVVLERAPAGRVRRDLVLTPEAVIAGRALDEHGAAVADAKIWIEPDLDGRRPPGEQSATLVAVTDVEGRFRFSGVHGGRHRLGGAARGMTAPTQPVIVAAGDDRDDVELRLIATGRVRGRVMRAGQPVAGASVQVVGGRSDTAVSQLDGSFVLDRVPAGEARFVAPPFRVTGPAVVEIAAGTEQALELEVAVQASVSGTVRRGGVPVPYARVNLNGPTRVAAQADGEGRYRADGLRAGTYGYFVDDKRRRAYDEGGGIEIGEAEERVLDFDLAAGARVTGVVVDGRGQPVGEVMVRFARDADEGRCMTDARGAFDCAQMSGGAYTAGVYASDHETLPLPFVGPPPPPVALADGDAHVDGVRLVIDPRRLAIHGRVVDEEGRPVADVPVYAWGTGVRRDRWSLAPSGVTDVDGAFAIDPLAPGAYELEVVAIDGARQTRVVAAGARDVELAVQRPTCAEAARAHRLRAEPAGIRARPPARVVWGERAEQIELVGWDLPTRVQRGTPFALVLYLRALAPLDRPWTVFVHVDGDRARHLADHEPLGGACPTSAWQPGDVLVDRVTTTVRPDLPTGRYAVWIGFFTGWVPTFRNLEVHTAPAAMEDATDRIEIADLIVE